MLQRTSRQAGGVHASAQWRGDIAGLRALAILPVILFHLGAPGFSGGFVGVDVFFVISGYLITGIIERSGENFSFSGFYERRLRRILPGFYAMAAAVTAVALVLFTPFNLVRYGRTLAAAAVFASNIMAAKETHYFDPSTVQRPLVHMWSLAIEEQFYLFFPLLMTWLAPRRLLRAKVLGGLFVVSLLGAVFLAHGKGGYYATPWRAFELMTGGLLALKVVPRPDRRLAEALCLAGLAAIIAAVALFTAKTPTPGLPTLLPCLGAGAILWAGEQGATLGGRILSLAPLRWIGAISYPLYLWHWPVLVFFRFIFLREPGLIDAVALVAITFALSVVTYRLIELPAQRLSRAAVFRASLIATLAAVAIGLGLEFTHGLDHWLSASRAAPAAEQESDGVCFLDTSQKGQAWSPRRCVSGPAGAPEVLLLGDSYAAHYAPGLRKLTSGGDGPPFRLALAAYPACAPLADYASTLKGDCAGFSAAVWDAIRAHPPTAVILSAKWSYDGQLSNLDGRADRLDAALAASIAQLKALGVRGVLVMGESPSYEIDVPQMLLALKLRRLPPLGRPVDDPSQDQRLAAVAARAGAQFFSPQQALCAAGTCRLTDDRGRVLQWDSGHFSLAGSDFMAQRLEPAIKGLVGP